MDRSLGFGSIICDLIRPFQTRSRFDSIPYLVFNLATYNNSPDRSTKSTISRLKSLYLLVNIGFQVLFHSPPGVLFTFPSRYLSLSVTKQYLALWGGPHLFIRDFTCLVLLWILPPLLLFHLQDSHLLWFAFPHNSVRFTSGLCSPLPHSSKLKWFRLFLFRSPLLQESSFLSFPVGTEMFQFPTFPSIYYFTYIWINWLFSQFEFPHSDIYGSLDICSLPQLFAAYHVLLRLLVPRHSPYALSSLTYFSQIKSYSNGFFGSIVSQLLFILYLYNMLVYLSSSSMQFSMYLVGSNGIEPSTSRLSGVRSNHLSYEPIYQSYLMQFSSFVIPTLFYF